MREESAVNFACGDARLYGILHLPKPTLPAPARGVLVVVGGPQYRAGSHRQFTLLARDLAAHGIPVMRFDYRGMGDSEGALRDFSAVGEDLRAAVDHFMASVPGMAEVALWGLCDGATAAGIYAAADRRVTGVALLNPWVRTDSGIATRDPETLLPRPPAGTRVLGQAAARAFRRRRRAALGARAAARGARACAGRRLAARAAAGGPRPLRRPRAGDAERGRPDGAGIRRPGQRLRRLAQACWTRRA